VPAAADRHQKIIRRCRRSSKGQGLASQLRPAAPGPVRHAVIDSLADTPQAATRRTPTASSRSGRRPRGGRLVVTLLVIVFFWIIEHAA
jgi:hypothetical protein